MRSALDGSDVTRVATARDELVARLANLGPARRARIEPEAAALLALAESRLRAAADATTPPVPTEAAPASEPGVSTSYSPGPTVPTAPEASDDGETGDDAGSISPTTTEPAEPESELEGLELPGT